nr:DUF4025 domain-containing protein [Bacillus ectoiniformans]
MNVFIYVEQINDNYRRKGETVKNNQKDHKEQVRAFTDEEITQGLDIVHEQLTDTYADGTVDRRIEQEKQ